MGKRRRMTTRLQALHDDRGKLWCGRRRSGCAGRLGSVDRVRGGVFLQPGFQPLDAAGIFRMSRHAKRSLSRGHTPANRRPLRISGAPDGVVYQKPIPAADRSSLLVHIPITIRDFPALVECPRCGSLNRIIDPG